MPMAPTPVKMEKPQARVSLNFPKGTESPSFQGMDVKQVVTLRVTGTVIGIRADEYGRNLEIRPQDVQIEGPEKPMSVDEALHSTRRRKD